MPTPATGELRRLGSGWEARIPIAGTRVGFTLTAIASKDEAGARARCTAMAEIAVRLQRAGHASETEKLLEMGARARLGKPWDAVMAAADLLCGGRTTASGAARGKLYQQRMNSEATLMTDPRAAAEWKPPNHRERHVAHGKFAADVDVAIADLVLACWKSGIETGMSCQGGRDEAAWIQFPTPRVAQRFVNVIRGVVESFEWINGDGTWGCAEHCVELHFARKDRRAIERAFGIQHKKGAK